MLLSAGSPIMISAGGVSHPGRVRPINEDVFVTDLELGFFMVADGMGGHNAGEIASRLAADTIHAFLARTQAGEDVTWPYGIDPALSFDANRLLTAVRLANRRIFKVAESREEYTGMGTTASIALFSGDHVIQANVGDSRIYSLTGAGLVQLTRDDTWITMMGNSEAAADPKHPMRHVLTNVVGARDQIDCGVTERVLEGAEMFLLSSDGLHGAIEPDTLEALLRTEDAPDVIGERLVKKALELGGGDNITALVIRYEPS